MTSEQLAGALVLAALGVGAVAVGALGRRGALDDALGGWTRESATDDSRTAAHRVIGSWFMVGGTLSCAGAPTVVVAPSEATGPAVAGTNRIQPR